MDLQLTLESFLVAGAGFSVVLEVALAQVVSSLGPPKIPNPSPWLGLGFHLGLVAESWVPSRRLFRPSVLCWPIPCASFSHIG